MAVKRRKCRSGGDVVEMRRLTAELKRAMRVEREESLREKARKIEEAGLKGDSKGLFSGVRDLCGGREMRAPVEVKSADGTIKKVGRGGRPM